MQKRIYLSVVLLLLGTVSIAAMNNEQLVELRKKAAAMYTIAETKDAKSPLMRRLGAPKIDKEIAAILLNPNSQPSSTEMLGLMAKFCFNNFVQVTCCCCCPFCYWPIELLGRKNAGRKNDGN